MSMRSLGDYLTPLYATILGVGLLLITSGCTAHRPLLLEAPQLPATFAESGSAIAREGGSDRWWEMFEDQTLNSLMAEGFRHNPDLDQAFAHLQELDALIRVANAPGRPSLSVDGSKTRARQPGATGITTSTAYRLAGSAAFELDLWQRLRSRSRAAALTAAASQEDIKTLYLSLTVRIAELYYLAVEQRAQIGLRDALIDSYARSLAVIEERYRAGLVAPGEVYAARQGLAAARAERPALQAGLATAEHGLAVLIGRFPGESVAGSLAVLPAIPDAYQEGLPSRLLTRRPDLVAAMLRVKARDALVAATIADRFPAFNLLGNYGSSRLDLGTIVKGGFWSLAGGVTQAVFDGGRRRAEVDKSKALLAQAVNTYEKTMLTAFQEVEDALVANRTTEERLGWLRDQQLLATAKVSLAESGYRLGLDGYLGLLASQRTVVEVNGRLLKARRQLISDRLSLLKALGGEWMQDLVVERLAE